MYFDEKQSANKCPLAVQLQRITDLDMHDHMLDHCDNVNKIMISVIWLNRNWPYSLYPSLDREGYSIDLGLLGSGKSMVRVFSQADTSFL